MSANNGKQMSVNNGKITGKLAIVFNNTYYFRRLITNANESLMGSNFTDNDRQHRIIAPML